MSDTRSITVTNRTTHKTIQIRLDISLSLADTRTALADLIAESDLFTDSTGSLIPKNSEAGTLLSAITGDKDAIAVFDPTKTPTPSENPINLEPFTPTLEPIELPDIEWASDQVGILDGLDAKGSLIAHDNVAELKVGQQRLLLKTNHIYLNRRGRGSASAFVVQDNLVWAKEDAVEFTQVSIRTEDSVREDRMSMTYDELEARLHKQTVSETKAGGGIPLIFRVDGSFQHSSATTTATKDVTIHMAASQLIPKARVTFKDKSISMSAEFTADVATAVMGSGPDVTKAERLLTVLGNYGQFVATDIMLGGRLTFSSDTTLHESQKQESVKNSFKLAAGARFDLEGVPAEVEGGTGTGTGSDSKDKIIAQAKSLALSVVGGHPSAASSKIGTLGTKWIPTLAKYLNWGVVGFHPQSLVPTIAYLNSDLRSRCVKLLKGYVTSQLQTRETEIVGSQGDERFAPPHNARRIVKVEVNHGINVDGLQVTYELENGSRQVVPWVGHRRGERNDAFELSFDEQISSIEVGQNDGTAHRLAFNTTKGNRHPSAGFYGRAEVKSTQTLPAPRVLGLVGASSALVHGIGLKYRVLANNLPHRNFLLALEPYLFPTNVPYHLDLTSRGVLLAGGWQSDDELSDMSPEAKRNTLIVVLAGSSNQPAGYFQSTPRDDDSRALVEKAAVVVFLLQAGLREQSWLKEHSDIDHLNTLVAFIHSHTDEPVAKLQGLSVGELVRWGWTIKGGAAGAVGAAAEVALV